MRSLSACLLLGLAASAFAAAPPALPLTTDSVGDPLPKDAIARLGTARFHVSGSHYASLALSPDGKFAATSVSGLDRPRTALIDVTTGREVKSLPTKAFGGSLVFSPDGKELMTTQYGGSLTFYDVAQAKEVRQYKTKCNNPSLFVFSADGSVLALSEYQTGRKPVVFLHEVESGKLISSVEPLHTGYAYYALSPDGKYLAAYGGPQSGGKPEEMTKVYRTVQLLDVKTGKEHKQFELTSTVTSLAFSPDKKTLAVAQYGDVQLWDFVEGKRLKTWRLPSSNVAGLVFSPDGKYLLNVPRGTSFTPSVWEVATGRRLSCARTPLCFLHGVGFRGGRMIAVGVQQQTLVVWDLLSGKRFDPEVGHSAMIAGVFARGGRVHTVGSDASLITWDLSGKQLALSEPPDRRPSSSGVMATAVFAPDGSSLSLSHAYGATTVRDPANNEELYTLPRGGPGLPAYSADGNSLALPTYDVSKKKGGVRIVRADSAEELLEFDPGAGTPAGVAIDPSGKRVAVALAPDSFNVPATVLTWRIDTKKQDEAFTKYEAKGATGYRMPVSLVYSPDGERLAVSGGQGGAVQFLDAATGKPGMTLAAGGPVLLPPVFSPDGRTLAVVTSGKAAYQVAIWELRSGKKRWEATVPSQPTALAFDESGLVLVSGHQDTTALVWDVSGRSQTGKALDADGWDGVVRDLGAADPAEAFAAQKALSAGLAVAELRQRLKLAPGKSLGEKELAKLIADLDDDAPTVRGRAYDTLEEQGKAAEAALKKALEGKPSAELRRSVTALLEKIARVGESAEALHAARVVEVLEWMGTGEAERMLRDVAGGRPSAPLTVEAKAALARRKR